MGTQANYLHRPSYGAQGSTEYELFDTGLVNADAELKNCYDFRTATILTATSFSGTNAYAATSTAITFSGIDVKTTTVTATTVSATVFSGGSVAGLPGLLADDQHILDAEVLTALPFIDSRSYTTLELANTAAYNAGKLLIISQNYTLTANTTLTAAVKVIKGGSFTKASTYILTINGPFEAGLYQVFSGFSAGNVTFGAGSVKEVYPEWWATNTIPGTTDMITALQSAENSLGSRGGIISLSATDYYISSGWKVGTGAWGNAIIVQGSGPVTTTIKGNLTSALIQSPNTGAANYRCTFKNFGIDNSNKTNAGGIGIDLTYQYLTKVTNVRFVNIETAIYIAGPAAYYNEIYGVEIHQCTTGIYLTGTRANENKILFGRMDYVTTGINVDKAFNVDIIGVAIEAATTGIILNDSEAKVIGCLFDTMTTGISITASGVNNILIGNTYTSCTTQVSNLGTNTQQFESTAAFRAIAGSSTLNGRIEKSARIQEFYVAGLSLDDATLALNITFASQTSKYVNHIVEAYVALGDTGGNVNYSSIVRYSVVSLNSLTITDMTHDLVGGVTETVSSTGTVMTITLTLPGGVVIDGYTVWVKIITMCDSGGRGLPTGITVN